MRDPKTHAKVLARRWASVSDELYASRTEPERTELLSKLLYRIDDSMDRLGGFKFIKTFQHDETGRAYVEIIPDTEEEG